MRRLLSPIPIAATCVVVALLALLAYGLGSTADDRSIDDAVAHGERAEAPAFDLAPLEGGEEKSVADYQGKVVVLNLWASWCEPCREESPLLQRWHKRIAPDGGLVLGVDVDDVSSDARAFIREYGLTYPMLRDPDGQTRTLFGAVGLPETFLIDRTGRIAATRRGPVTERWMREEVLPLLDERT